MPYQILKRISSRGVGYAQLLASESRRQSVDAVERPCRDSQDGGELDHLDTSSLGRRQEPILSNNR